jgi:hypothetical protein
LGQSLAIVGANYLLAIKGKNFTEPKAEIAFLTACIFTLVALQAPYMFMRQLGVETIERTLWWDSNNPIIAPDSRFGWLIYPATGLAVYAIVRVWRHFAHPNDELDSA